MRLGALLLGAALALAAQAPPRGPLLPWENAPMPPWQAEAEGPWTEPPPPPEPGDGKALRLRLRPDGSLRVTDAKGTIRLSLGLPGRPAKAWRDGGRPMDVAVVQGFPDRTPLTTGRGGLLFTAADPREALEGLAWVLDDGERRLTVVHPATGRAVHLRLPEGQSLDLAFFPDRLELRERVEAGPRRPRRRWSLTWVALLPQLARLGPAAVPPVRGTALNPFPRE